MPGKLAFKASNEKHFRKLKSRSLIQLDRISCERIFNSKYCSLPYPHHLVRKEERSQGI